METVHLLMKSLNTTICHIWESRDVNDQISHLAFSVLTECQEEKCEQTGAGHVPEVHRLPHEGAGESEGCLSPQRHCKTL